MSDIRLANVKGKLALLGPDGVVVDDVERVARFLPRMLDLLRGAGDWYCGELPDGTDRRKAIAALLAEIDGAG